MSNSAGESPPPPPGASAVGSDGGSDCDGVGTAAPTPTTASGTSKEDAKAKTEAVPAAEAEEVLAPDEPTFERPTHPYVDASFLSRLLFAWPRRLMARRRRGADGDDDDSAHRTAAAIEERDLPDVLPDDESGRNLDRFLALWEAEKARAAGVRDRSLARGGGGGDDGGGKGGSGDGEVRPLPKAARPSLHRALVADFLRTMWIVQPLMFLACAAKLVQALALGYLLQTFDASSSASSASSDSYFWAGVLVLCGFVVLMEHHHVFFWTWRKGMQYRISCVAAVYDKSLRLSSTSTGGGGGGGGKVAAKGGGGGASAGAAASSTGRIVNIATNDVERFLTASLFASYVFWAPLTAVAILVLGWSTIGWSFAAGFGLLVSCFVPLQLWLSG
ncbi:hypothetical protein ACHAWF_001144, partial [Thalassiosira exigua]